MRCSQHLHRISGWDTTVESVGGRPEGGKVDDGPLTLSTAVEMVKVGGVSEFCGLRTPATNRGSEKHNAKSHPAQPLLRSLCGSRGAK